MYLRTDWPPPLGTINHVVVCREAANFIKSFYDMDPLSAIGIAANFGQLADLASKIIVSLYKYFDDFRTAPARSAELRDELNSLVGLLKTLEQALMIDGEDPVMTDELKITLQGLTKVIQELRGHVGQGKMKGMERLKWPFKKEENERFISRITTYKGTLILALNMEERFTIPPWRL